MIWGGLSDLGAFGKSNWNQSNQNQSTCKQDSWKVCVEQCHGQDENGFGIYWTILLQFGLGIMCKEGFWEVLIFGLFRSKTSNFEGLKIWGMDVGMGLYLRKYKFLVYWWNVVYCVGVLSSSNHFLIFKNFYMLLGGVKDQVETSDFMKVFKIGISVGVGFISVELCIKLISFYFCEFQCLFWCFLMKISWANLKVFETVQNRYVE